MKKFLTLPISEEEIRSLRIGDTLYLNGVLATCRDSGHRRIVIENTFPDFDFKGKAVFHAGPIIQKNADGKYKMISIGPTSSIRMESYEAEFIEKTAVRMIIGKGGMGNKTAKACKLFGAVHCIFPGGCALVASECVKNIQNTEWQDLGMPEALWVLEVKDFGPLTVSIDCLGNNLFENNKKKFQEKALKLYQT